jgi:hypothetical protein
VGGSLFPNSVKRFSVLKDVCREKKMHTIIKGRQIIILIIRTTNEACTHQEVANMTAHTCE